MQSITATEAAQKWGIGKRRVQVLCTEGRIYGAEKHGNIWMIPADAPKPLDARATRYKVNSYALPKKQCLTSIDLFAGPGGLATGFRWAGIKPLIAVEWSYWTVQTYASSHDAEILDLELYLQDPTYLDVFLTNSERPILIFGDINKVETSMIKALLQARYNQSTVDIVTGGAPCESFSMAGDRKEVDERNQLYQNVLRIARGVNSKMFMFENVKGLFSKKHNGKVGAMYQAICDEFEGDLNDGSPTYRLASREKNDVLLKATDYGVPQARERLFLVGINNAYPDLKFEYPKPSNGANCDYDYVTVSDALGDLPSIATGRESKKYCCSLKGMKANTAQNQFLRRMRGDLSMPPKHIDFREDSLSGHKAPGHTKNMLSRFKLIKQGESMKTAFERLNAEGRAKEAAECFPKKIYGARNRRLKPNEPAFTVTSHCLDEMIHPTSNRGLTPREAARLQSFPDWYEFKGPYIKFHSDPEQDQYEQIGDAIPPLLAYALGKEISETLRL
ncbi:MAG: DNA cytosine methyltransferase [Eggerthellaceae bacterium]